jgi:Flp pilus assembly protein TadG
MANVTTKRRLGSLTLRRLARNTSLRGTSLRGTFLRDKFLRDKFLRDTSASEIAEFAMIVPLLFMFLIAIFWFGQAFRVYGTLTQATRAGARAAVAPVCATCPASGSTPAQIAQTAVTNAMSAAHLNTAQLVPTSQWTVPVPNLCQCNSGGTSASSCTSPVSCDASVSIQMCVQPNVQLSYPTGSQGGMGTCGTSVSLRYQYPFSFKIPLTNLDLGNIQIPGQSQMRVETQ